MPTPSITVSGPRRAEPRPPSPRRKPSARKSRRSSTRSGRPGARPSSRAKAERSGGGIEVGGGIGGDYRQHLARVLGDEALADAADLGQAHGVLGADDGNRAQGLVVGDRVGRLAGRRLESPGFERLEERRVAGG